MVSGVLSLAERSVRSIMTPRSELSWIDIEQDADTLRRQILATPHSFFPVCRGQLDEILGVARGKDLIGTLAEQGRIDETSLRPPIVVPESIRILPLMETLRASRGQLVLVTDEYGAVLGVVTPVDVLEAIAGEFPDEDEHPTIAAAGQGRWLIDGSADLHAVAHVLELGEPWTQSQGRYASLGGLLLDRFGIVPPAGSAIDLDGYRFTVVEATERRIDRIEVVRLGAESVQAAADAGQRER